MNNKCSTEQCKCCKSMIWLVVILIIGLLAVEIYHHTLLDDENDHHPMVTSDQAKHNINFNSCVTVALSKHPGAVLSAEIDKEDGKNIFEVDIQGEDGKKWEIECDALSGLVLKSKVDD